MYKHLLRKNFSTKNPFQSTAHKALKLGTNSYNYYDINTLGNLSKNNFVYFLGHLPISIRVLLESALRNCDEFSVKSKKKFIFHKILFKKLKKNLQNKKISI